MHQEICFGKIKEFKYTINIATGYALFIRKNESRECPIHGNVNNKFHGIQIRRSLIFHIFATSCWVCSWIRLWKHAPDRSHFLLHHAELVDHIGLRKIEISNWYNCITRELWTKRTKILCKHFEKTLTSHCFIPSRLSKLWQKLFLGAALPYLFFYIFFRKKHVECFVDILAIWWFFAWYNVKPFCQIYL